MVSDIAYDRIFVKQGIDGVEGKTLHFADGAAEEFDVLIAATGYLIELPFLSPDVAPIENNGVKLYKRIVPPDWPGLYFIGMTNITTALNVNYEHQAKWTREFILGNAVLPSRRRCAPISKPRTNSSGPTTRPPRGHAIEEEHLRYFPALKKSLREAVVRGRRLAPSAA